MKKDTDLVHFNEDGLARMIDVSGKEATLRTAAATAKGLVHAETFELIKGGRMAKGDVLGVAQVAGIMAAKKTAGLIPMCHPLAITGVDINFELDEKACAVLIEATVKCLGETGVEMEALTAASVAALTVYDMCKSAQKDIRITDICLLSKTGGKSGDYFVNKEDER